jgi:hypothetical protein
MPSTVSQSLISNNYFSSRKEKSVIDINNKVDLFLNKSGGFDFHLKDFPKNEKKDFYFGNEKVANIENHNGQMKITFFTEKPCNLFGNFSETSLYIKSEGKVNFCDHVNANNLNIRANEISFEKSANCLNGVFIDSTKDIFFKEMIHAEYLNITAENIVANEKISVLDEVNISVPGKIDLKNGLMSKTDVHLKAGNISIDNKLVANEITLESKNKVDCNADIRALNDISISAKEARLNGKIQTKGACHINTIENFILDDDGILDVAKKIAITTNECILNGELTARSGCDITAKRIDSSNIFNALGYNSIKTEELYCYQDSKINLIHSELEKQSEINVKRDFRTQKGSSFCMTPTMEVLNHLSRKQAAGVKVELPIKISSENMTAEGDIELHCSKLLTNGDLNITGKIKTSTLEIESKGNVEFAQDIEAHYLKVKANDIKAGGVISTQGQLHLEGINVVLEKSIIAHEMIIDATDAIEIKSDITTEKNTILEARKVEHEGNLNCKGNCVIIAAEEYSSSEESKLDIAQSFIIKTNKCSLIGDINVKQGLNVIAQRIDVNGTIQSAGINSIHSQSLYCYENSKVDLVHTSPDKKSFIHIEQGFLSDNETSFSVRPSEEIAQLYNNRKISEPPIVFSSESTIVHGKLDLQCAQIVGENLHTEEGSNVNFEKSMMAISKAIFLDGKTTCKNSRIKTNILRHSEGSSAIYENVKINPTHFQITYENELPDNEILPDTIYVYLKNNIITCAVRNAASGVVRVSFKDTELGESAPGIKSCQKYIHIGSIRKNKKSYF